MITLLCEKIIFKVLNMADTDEPGTKTVLSFGFKKILSDVKVTKRSALGENDTSDVPNEPDLVTSVEGKEVQSTKPKEKPKELVIPLIERNRWRISDDSAVSTLESEAVQQILEDAAAANENWDNRNQDNPSLVVPLLMRNKVPDGFETDDNLDVSLRPDEADDADYEKIPIESFGMAMLRGMGFKEDQGVGKNSKVVAPVDAVVRPKGMGLGADKRALHNMEVKKNTSKSKDEDELLLKKGAYGMVEIGAHKGLYGKVEGLDEDNARVMVKLTISNQTTTISQYAFKLVSKSEYEKYSKYLNKSKTDEYKEKQMRNGHDNVSDGTNSERTKDTIHRSKHSESKRDRDSHSHRDQRERQTDRDKKRKHETDGESDKRRKNEHSRSSSNSRPGELWVRPQIRVRLIDKDYKKGRYYNSKVEVVDVVDKYTCVCRTEDSKVLEGISQSMLETVIPKAENSFVIIVHGKERGQLAQIVKKDKSKCRATVQLLRDRDCVLKLDYENICEFTGDVDVEFDY